jgi:TolB protein
MKRILLLLFVLMAWVNVALADLTIEITEGVEGALPIAVVPFGWQGQGSGKPPVDVSAVINADL